MPSWPKSPKLKKRCGRYTSVGAYLHLIGIEILVILATVARLLDDKVHKRALFIVCVAVLGFMLIHFAFHVLPNRLADFIYGSHRDYRPVETQESEQT